ncbi:MAG: amidohydrolase family protein [Gemmatimonadetes bacterium]|nr:amidohydrolase family protein [Gemmatimonadota bacterium]
MLADALDSHVHFWNPGMLEYPWLEALPALRRPFLPPDFRLASARSEVRHAVFVEANPRPDLFLEEVRFAEALPEVVGIVAFADLTEPDTLRGRLDSLAAHARVKGIRQNIQGQPPGFALQPAFVNGVREAGRRGLTFDLCATHDQLVEVAELCRRCPDTRLVLDHCGKPPIRGGNAPGWAAGLAEIASQDHVWCKVSGLLTEAEPFAWRDDDLLPFAEHVVRSFGPDRLLYGSDWPVLTLAGNYRGWYEFTRRLTGAWSADETQAFYHGNATRFYQL